VQEIGFYSYIFASLGFLGLLLLLLTTSISSLSSKLLFFSVLCTAIWCCLVGVGGMYDLPIIFTFIPEVLKSFAWGLLCMNLLLKEEKLISLFSFKHQFSWFFPTVGLSFLILTLAINGLLDDIYLLFMSLLTLSISHLIMIEFLYRQGSSDFKWGFKPLAIAIAAYAIIDLTIYSTSILTTQLNHQLFWARGAIYLLLVPLLIIGIKRHKSLGVRLFISRAVVFHSTLLLGIAVYLITMSIVGYYLKLIGGQWGVYSQLLFIVLALAMLVFLFLSESLRSKIKVFISKHFFANRYDYRQQWLKLNANLAASKYSDYQENALYALMDLFDIQQGALYLFNANSNIELAASIGLQRPLPDWRLFLRSYQSQQTQWIIDLDEYERFPEIYPNTLDNIEPMNDGDMRLVVPMQGPQKLSGYVVLSRPGHHKIVNYEDRDLLSTAAQQLVNFIDLNKANQEILEATQFAAFNRMSAFLVHDLKNIVAQLSLTSSNAMHHRDNPEFIDDTFDTIDNAVTKMNKILAQLRSKKSDKDQQRSVALDDLFSEIISRCSAQQPCPTINCQNNIILFLNHEKLTNIIMHLIHNSQQACTDKDSIKLSHCIQEERHIITIEDTGCGMSEAFIRNRLFKPFDTTKGNAGMGIGAYEAKQYIEGIGGGISVKSAENKGTRISLTLPEGVIRQ